MAPAMASLTQTELDEFCVSSSEDGSCSPIDSALRYKRRANAFPQMSAAQTLDTAQHVVVSKEEPASPTSEWNGISQQELEDLCEECPEAAADDEEEEEDSCLLRVRRMRFHSGIETATAFAEEVMSKSEAVELAINERQFRKLTSLESTEAHHFDTVDTETSAETDHSDSAETDSVDSSSEEEDDSLRRVRRMHAYGGMEKAAEFAAEVMLRLKGSDGRQEPQNGSGSDELEVSCQAAGPLRKRAATTDEYTPERGGA